MRFIGSYTVNSLVQKECHQITMLGNFEKSLHLGNVLEYVIGNVGYILVAYITEKLVVNLSQAEHVVILF